MPFIEANGSRTVLVPANQFLAVSSFGGGITIIRQSVPNAQNLFHSQLVDRLINNSNVYGAVSFDSNYIIQAGLNEVEYVIGIVPVLSKQLLFNVNFASAAGLKQVTNRVAVPMQRSGTNTQSGWRSWQISYVAVTSLRIYLPNFYVLSGVETACGGVQIARISVEYPRGTFTPIQTVSIPDFSYGYVDVPVNIPPFTWFRINGDMNYAAGGFVPAVGWTNACDRGGGDEYSVGAAGYGHTQDDTVLGSGNASSMHPLLVLAQSNRLVWGVIGDSIAAGVNDAQSDPNGGRGLVGRALAEIGPHVNFGCPGDQAVLYAAGSTLRNQLMQLSGMTKAFLELGVNDFFTGSRTSTNVLTDRQTIRNQYPGVTFYDTTITPATTTTDNWQTAVNQTTTSATPNTNRIAFNDSLRAGTALGQGSLGTLDIAAEVETSSGNQYGPVIDGGVWIPGIVGYSDGVHPNSNGYIRTNNAARRFLVNRI